MLLIENIHVVEGTIGPNEPKAFVFFTAQAATAYLQSGHPAILDLDYKGHWLDIYEPICGHKAIEYWINQRHEVMPDGIVMPDFLEPWQTGLCGWETAKQAYHEAWCWAADECLPIVYRYDLLPG